MDAKMIPHWKLSELPFEVLIRFIVGTTAALSERHHRRFKLRPWVRRPKTTYFLLQVL